jgi:glutathione S-transferase
MTEPVVFGASYSVYVRAVRLALVEKAVAYRLVEVDIFADEVPAEYLARQPFKRIPAFEHDGFRLYETGAILRYIDDAFPGPRLLPVDRRQRARVDQLLGITDSYAYRPLVRDVYVERVLRPLEGKASDEARIAGALPAARTCLRAIEELIAETGPRPSLADLLLTAMAVYFMQAPEIVAITAECPRVAAWWEEMKQRPSVAAVAPP